MPLRLPKPHFDWGNRISVIPAGERWEDNSLRPSLEDWIGAGAIIDELSGSFSPEAQAALDVYRATRYRFSAKDSELASLAWNSLIRGYETDVALASELDVSCCVPILDDIAYVSSAGLETHAIVN